MYKLQEMLQFLRTDGMLGFAAQGLAAVGQQPIHYQNLLNIFVNFQKGNRSLTRYLRNPLETFKDQQVFLPVWFPSFLGLPGNIQMLASRIYFLISF